MSVQDSTAALTTPDIGVVLACFRWHAGALEFASTADHALPHAAPTIQEELDATAERVTHEHFPLPPAYSEQLYTFSTFADDRRQTAVSYLVLYGSDGDPAPDPRRLHWNPARIRSDVVGLDATVLDYALVRLRAKIAYTSIAFHLLPPVFTLAEVQDLYETILDASLDKRNFRRRMVAGGMLVDTGNKRRQGPHRPATLYRFSGQTDQSNYLTPTAASQELH